MNIHHKALIVVADGAKFLLLRNTGNFRTPELVFEGGGEKENPATRLQGTDRPGRTASGGGLARGAIEQTDFHQIEEDKFAVAVSDLLGQLLQSGDFEELIIVAPPKCLAELRKHLSDQVSSRIVAEVAKDLTKHPVSEITEILAREGEG